MQSASIWRTVSAFAASPTNDVNCATRCANRAGASEAARCLGLVTVAATNPYGVCARYSNFGPRVDLSAPGGEAGRLGPAAAIFSTANSGPNLAASPSYAVATSGTSLAAPHVAGVASLVAAANSNLGASQVKQPIIETVTPFPGGSDCHPGICGAGILNAYGAVHRAATMDAPGPGDITPVAGVWWNPNESGSEYGVDFKDCTLVVQIYSYLAGGPAQWYLAAGRVIGNTFSATLDKYVGGQCISCVYRGPTRAGGVRRRAAPEGAASLAPERRWPAGRAPIQANA